jgi:transposase-like protein
MIARFKLWVCRHLHGRPMHPIHGRYRCPRCHRTWPVAWEGDARPHAASPAGRVA